MISGRKDKTSWVLPLVVVALFTVICELIIVSVVKVPYILQNWIGDDMNEESVLSFVQLLTSPSTRLVMATFIIGYISIILALKAGLYQMLLQIQNYSAAYEDVLAVICFSAITRIVKYLIIVPLAMITLRASPDTSFAVFADEATSGWLVGLLSSFDLFILWEYILCAIGLQVVCKISFKHAVIASAVLFILHAAFNALKGGIL